MPLAQFRRFCLPHSGTNSTDLQKSNDTPTPDTQEYMFEELIGKKAILTRIDGDGTAELCNLTVLKGEGCLVTIEDTEGMIRVLNMSSPHNIELKQQ